MGKQTNKKAEKRKKQTKLRKRKDNIRKAAERTKLKREVQTTLITLLSRYQEGMLTRDEVLYFGMKGGFDLNKLQVSMNTIDEWKKQNGDVEDERIVPAQVEDRES